MNGSWSIFISNPYEGKNLQITNLDQINSFWLKKDSKDQTEKKGLYDCNDNILSVLQKNITVIFTTFVMP